MMTGKRATNFPVQVGLVLTMALFIAGSVVGYRSVQRMKSNQHGIARADSLLLGLQEVMGSLRDAETSYRGYVIAADGQFLEPLAQTRAKLPGQRRLVRRLVRDDPKQQRRMAELEAEIDRYMEWVDSCTTLVSQGDRGQALAAVRTGRGKAIMDGLRSGVTDMQQAEKVHMDERKEEMAHSVSYLVLVISGTGAMGILLALLLLAFSIRKEQMERRAVEEARSEEWLRRGLDQLQPRLIGEKSPAMLAGEVVESLGAYLDAQVGALYVKIHGVYHLRGTYALPEGGAPAQLLPGEGLLGQAEKGAQPYVVENVPENYLTAGSSLGKSAPRHLVIAAAQVDGHTNAAIELGFFQPVRPEAIELLKRAGSSIGMAVKSAMYLQRTQDLLEETQRQGEELQAQSEELRVNNQELEEQGRVLRETQSRMEEQQSELEQANAQLEEQTALLETQKRDLQHNQGQLLEQARSLEMANQYKTEFMANLSHELRTPLNSTLILAKLLEENRGGNLTDEQVKFAGTIRAAGTDLLALINDVLDVSKVEAGHMELNPATMAVEDLLEKLRSTFLPLAQERGISLQVQASPQLPKTMCTDAQRLEQVLKNLLSNALKFTEQGRVTLEVFAPDAAHIAFSVQDTGIGIAPEHQQQIFEPFTQVDGTTSRKYGGTGLGLSISRDLVHLLGGTIELQSESGKGSVFTITLPLHPEAPLGQEPPPPVATPPKEPLPDRNKAAAPRTRVLPDDRDQLRKGERSVLIIEDDERFAALLSDLAREQQFQTLVAIGANEGLDLAFAHLPSAVLLDIGLPDNSGMYVLERLKHNASTRHIPVHVISGSDHRRAALAAGAVGYLLKPVKREELARTFRALNERLNRTVKRMLLVEHKPEQRDSLQELLAVPNVEVITASDPAQCLRLLAGNTFECLVLDLDLPHKNAFRLLEELHKAPGFVFPPIIVITERELSPEEEERLRDFSASVIIQGGIEPERLLDEVTLFLHQVVKDLPVDQLRMLHGRQGRTNALEGRTVLIVEDDARNIFALGNVLEQRGMRTRIARNGVEALAALDRAASDPAQHGVDLVLMDIMMPEMDGIAAMKAIRKQAVWKKLPIIALTAKAMPSDQMECLAAGASDYLAKPLDVDKLLSLVQVWMPR
jgi:signal transduction histidine kinase/DNA-binding response OmpR family regulator/CHASE3 domain sensor protein